MSEHFIVNSDSLQQIFEANKSKFQIIPLKEYLQLGLKPRGTDPKTALNSHSETMITRNLEEKPLENSDDAIALAKIGNANQTIYAMVQGYNPDNPNSGFERPVLEEGPHMVIGLYAFDHNGQLHIFRTLQMRCGRLVVDTPRGFASADMLNGREQIYTANPDQVRANLVKIVKEETGALIIRDTDFIGADICNTSCIISKSACYAVEISYSKFIKTSVVLTQKECNRRAGQLQHEGLIGGVIDMTVEQYLAYKNNPNIVKDMTADHISDLIIMRYLSKKLS